ncbi:hypothetical protein Ac42p007 [Acinetobacter phage Ac42]|uniref:hypothetical protein n=1 Tax=Acinetobacter phage Ac42 TaxID=762660 RepID=UPI0001EBCC69|nr:hypothetical protein Ac42p007 [Acinetobacter phage Ac42]ADI96245.1 hypothetical protein Ac42p007 [Acinetobacter phage Ac42]
MKVIRSVVSDRNYGEVGRSTSLVANGIQLFIGDVVKTLTDHGEIISIVVNDGYGAFLHGWESTSRHTLTKFMAQYPETRLHTRHDKVDYDSDFYTLRSIKVVEELSGKALQDTIKQAVIRLQECKTHSQYRSSLETLLSAVK